MGPGTDSTFDDTLQSLGKIAFKHTKAVIDSILRWRRSQNENVGSDIIKFHISQPPVASRIIRMSDVPGLLNERKSLASIYIMCRSLIAVLQAISVAKDSRMRHGNGFVLSKMYVRRFPFSMYSETMKIRPSGSGALDKPRYKTTLGCRASLCITH